ncbi:MAG: adenylate/guanylate cyclase domain-containing protein, partial [Fibrobacterota bacterium]
EYSNKLPRNLEYAVYAHYPLAGPLFISTSDSSGSIQKDTIRRFIHTGTSRYRTVTLPARGLLQVSIPVQEASHVHGAPIQDFIHATMQLKGRRALFYGMSLALIILLAVFFIHLRRRAYLYFAVHIFFLLLLHALIQGFGESYLGISLLQELRIRFIAAAGLAGTLFMLLFFHSLEKRSDARNNSTKNISFLTSFIIVEIVLILTLEPYHFLARIAAATVLISTIVPVISAVRTYPRQKATALIYVTALLPYTLANILFAIHFLSGSYESFIRFAPLFSAGVSMELILITLALTYQIRDLNRENNESRDRQTQTTLQLSRLTESLHKFVPKKFLHHLGHSDIARTRLGDCVEKRMTILFADIRDFTTLSESLSPLENFRFLNSYLSRIEPIIINKGGFIDKFIGDAVMAIFEDAEDAVSAGIEIQKEVKTYNRHRARCNYAPISVGIGINTGDLMLGIIGGQSRMDSTVISDAVNLASRIEGFTKKYHTPIIISEETYMDIVEENRYKYLARYLAYIRVKGRDRSTLIIEIVNSDSALTRKQKKENLHQFNEAVVRFTDGEYEAAGNLFSQIRRKAPDDRVAGIYLQQCRKEEKRAL